MQRDPPSFRGRQRRRLESIEPRCVWIPGSMLRIAPEWRCFSGTLWTAGILPA
jgi:hypothetical protein